MKITILVFTFALSACITHAQSSDFGSWYNYFGNKVLNDRFNVHHEVQYRNYNFGGDLEQLMLRTGLGYTFNSKINFLLGYGFIRSENYILGEEDKAIINEHRIFQQFITKQRLGRLNLQHRYRFEQRFIGNDNTYRSRLRYFLGVTIPLNNKEMIDKTVYLSGYNEIFVGNKGNFFDRNRIYGGVGYKLNASLRFELAYMNQLTTSFSRDQLNVVCFFKF